MLRHGLLVAVCLAALGGPALAQGDDTKLNRDEVLFCASIHYTLMKLPERKDDAAGIDLDGKRVGMLLGRAEDLAKAEGVSAAADKDTVVRGWLELRDKVDKSPTPAARADFITQLNDAAQECVGRAR
jgi:hypothetical protein